MIDDAAGVEDGGVFDGDVGANGCTGGNYDIFADASVAGEGRGGVNGVDEIDAGVGEGFGVLSSSAVFADGDDGAADAHGAESGCEREVAEDFDAVARGVFEVRVGVEEAGDVELMIVPEDVEDDAAVSAGADDDDFHSALKFISVKVYKR